MFGTGFAAPRVITKPQTPRRQIPRTWRWMPVLLLALANLANASELDAADTRLAQSFVKKHCARCHGVDGLGVNKTYASLAGQPPDYLLKQLFNFKTGQRQSPIMEPIANRLSARESYLVTEYFSGLPSGRTSSTDQTAIAAGRKLYFEGNPQTGVPNCLSCHGADARGGGVVARLAGQNPQYLANQLHKLNDRSRSNDRSMHAAKTPLSGAEISSLATYLSNLQ